MGFKKIFITGYVYAGVLLAAIYALLFAFLVIVAVYALIMGAPV